MAPTFAAVELVVADMATTLAFYRRLGLDIPADADHEAHVGLTFPGGLQLMFDTETVIASFDHGWTRPARDAASGGHRAALAFACDGPAAVDETHDLLVAAGAVSHLAPWDAYWGMRYAVVLDPDGTHVDLFAPLPGS